MPLSMHCAYTEGAYIHAHNNVHRVPGLNPQNCVWDGLKQGYVRTYVRMREVPPYPHAHRERHNCVKQSAVLDMSCAVLNVPVLLLFTFNTQCPRAADNFIAVCFVILSLPS